LRKLEDPEGPFAAIVLAAAGVKRLGLADKITERFSDDVMLPAAGQGALAIQCLKERQEVVDLLAAIHHRETGIETSAERAFIDRLGAGCNAAVGASARIIDREQVALRTICLSPDGAIASAREDFAPIEEAVILGCRLADSMISEQSGMWSRAMLG
jgi:hydroxymethylbilane synthase